MPAAIDYVMRRARGMQPGAFAMVMATGIVAVGAVQHAMPIVGKALFALSVVAYLWLLLISVLRLVRYPAEMIADFREPGRGAAFLTFPAGTCVLATQCIQVVHLPTAARALAVWGAFWWVVLNYLFLFSAMTRRDKAPFSETINGRWLVVVVATQALALLIALLARDGTMVPREGLLFAAVVLYLVGCAWYLILITFITYRMVLLPLAAREFTPPYWINMGALAISALAGSLILSHAPLGGPLSDLYPFIKGFTLFYWAMATWWIPLLVLLELWRHVWSGVPVNYAVNDWDIAFPVGMYIVCTTALAHAIGANRLLAIPDVGVYVSLAVWVLVAIGLVWRLVAEETGNELRT